MKKSILTLAVLLMALGNWGLAQPKTQLKQNANDNVFKHYGIREETSVVPQTAVWHTASGEDYRTTYTYDEYDYYLIEELIETKLDNNWLGFSLSTYEYDFSGNVLEILVQEMEYGTWTNDEMASYSYENGELSEVIYQDWENGQWVNETKEVYNYNGDVTTVLYWDWNGSNWSSDELWTYTHGDGFIEVIIQYMEGGAWQYDEKLYYILDFEENVTETVYSEWTGTDFENALRKVYDYQGGVYVSMVEQEWLQDSWSEPRYRCDYVYEDGNATHGECHFLDTYPTDYELEMAYGYNASAKVFYCQEVDMTYIDLTDLNENTQANFKVFPVPAENDIFIEAVGFQKAEIYSVTGQKVMESLQQKVDISALSSGVYVLKVFDKEGNSNSQRMVVK